MIHARTNGEWLTKPFSKNFGLVLVIGIVCTLSAPILFLVGVPASISIWFLLQIPGYLMGIVGNFIYVNIKK